MVTATVRTVELPQTAKRKREKEEESPSVVVRSPRGKGSVSVSIPQEKVPEEPEDPKKRRPMGVFSVAIRAMRGLGVRTTEPDKHERPVSLCSKVNYVQPQPHVGVIGATGSSSESSRRGYTSQRISSVAVAQAPTVSVEATYTCEDGSPGKGSPTRRTVDRRRTADSGGRNSSSGGSNRGNGKTNNRDKKKKEVPLPSRRSSR